MDEQLQQQVVLLVLAAMQGDQQAQQTIEQVMQAAQQGDQQAALIAQMILTVAQQMLQQQVQAAKFGAKLNYVKQLRGACPDGYEMKYFKSGGQLCKKCVAKQKMQEGGETPKDLVDAFKCGRKMKKKQTGGTVDEPKKVVKNQNPAGPIKPKQIKVTWPATKNNGYEYSEGWSSYADGSGRTFRNEQITGPNGTYIDRHIIYNPYTPNDTLILIRDNSGREQIYKNGEPGFRIANDRAFKNAKLNTQK